MSVVLASHTSFC